MASKPLTDTACKNAKPREKAWKLFDGHGLHLLIDTQGRRYWRLAYRFNEKQKTLAIGVYPEVSLAEAREKREAARKQLRDGIDPGDAKQEAKRLSRLAADHTL